MKAKKVTVPVERRVCKKCHTIFSADRSNCPKCESKEFSRFNGAEIVKKEGG